jgi:hypothetical protein
VRKWRQAAAMAALAVAGLGGPCAAVAQASAKAPASPEAFRGVKYLKNVISPAVASPTAVATGKVMGNRRDDLVVTTVDRDSNGGGTTVAVYPQRADGRLGKPLTVKSPDRNDVTTRVTITDLYGNGQREILLPEEYHVAVFAVRHGHLKASQIPVDANDLTVGNFNGDKHPDLLVATTRSGVFQIWAGSARHTFTLWRTVKFRHPAGFTSSAPSLEVFHGDFDHNGRQDAAILTGTGFAVRLQTSRGKFGPEKSYKIRPVKGVLFPPASMAVGDVTGNGRPDVVVDTAANKPWSGVEVFASKRNGTFRAPAIYHVLDIPAGMAIADLNHDGRRDLVVEHGAENYVGVLRQRPDGTLAPEKLHAGDLPFYVPPAVGDLNGDGKPDIALPAGDDHGIAIWYAR